MVYIYLLLALGIIIGKIDRKHENEIWVEANAFIRLIYSVPNDKGNE